MAFMEWDERFSVGMLEVDEERKRLIRILNTLFDEMKPQTWDECLEGLLEELYECLLRHARTEEDIFTRFHYPKRQEHGVEHFRISKYWKSSFKSTMKKK